jgi:hypothetical protein
MHYKSLGGDNVDNMFLWSANKPGIENLYTLTDMYYSFMRYEDAERVLKSIPQHPSWKMDMQADYQAYSQLYYLKKEAKLDGRHLFSMNEEEITTLQTVAENNSLKWASLKARSILNTIEGIEPFVCISFNEPLSNNKKLNESVSVSEKENKWFKEYPNPAQDYISLEYFIPEEFSSARVEVIDMQGRKIIVKNIVEGGLKNMNLDLSNIANGTYNYTIFCDKVKHHSDKFVVLK